MILEVESLATGYRDVKVVHDISLQVEEGSVTAMLGRNGAGKTTTLHAIAGLLPTNGGQIVLSGKDLAGVKAPKRAILGIALVQEGKRVFKGMTIDQNLTMGAYSRRLSRSKLEESKEAIYERFPALANRRGTAAGSLSGGQQQMLAIGQALMAQPRVLLLDEPSAGLAPAITAEIFDIVVQLRGEGMGILLVEQSVDFALNCADRLVVVDLGRKVFEGTPADPDVRDKIAKAFMGSPVQK